MSQKPDTFVIIDGNSLMHRAFHALPPLSNEDGVYTTAVFDFFFPCSLRSSATNSRAIWRSRSICTGRLSDHKLSEYKAGRKPTRAGIESAIRPCARMSGKKWASKF